MMDCGVSLITTANEQAGGAEETHYLGLPVGEGPVCATDPFDDFDDDDFDDEFDDDFEEEWDDELPGDEDQFEPDEVEEVDAPIRDDPDFDDED